MLAPILALVLAGCAVHRPGESRPAAVPAPPAFTAAYAAAACAGKRVYRLDRGASRVRVFVGKAGVLSGAGHLHVVAIEQIRGFAAVGAHGGKADLAFRLAHMRVDPPDVRSALGGEYAEVHMSAEQRAGTRANMLRSLDAENYPWVHLGIRRRASKPRTPVRVRITLHGQTHTRAAPARIQAGLRTLSASGSFDIRQTAFGIEPYSILLGALRVKDKLRIRYHLAFRRWHPPAAGACASSHRASPGLPP